MLPKKGQKEKFAVDPSGKEKSISIPLNNEDITTAFHWNKRTRMKWTVMFFFGILLVYCVRTSISVCAVAMGKELGWNKQIAGMALSAFFCGYVTTNVLGGYLADRHGGEVVIFYSAIIWALLTTILPLLAHSGSLLYTGTSAVLATRFLTGAAQGAFFPSLTSMLAKHVATSERGFVFSFAYSGSALGTILTGFVGSLLIEHVGWPSVFTLVGISSLIWVACMRCLYNSVSKRHKHTEKYSVKPKEPVPWLKLASSTPVWALFVGYFCSSVCFYNLLSWTPIYFHDAFPESKGWIFNVIPWMLNFILTNLSGYVANILLSSGTTITFVRKTYASVLFLGVSVFSILLNSVETFQQALFIMTMTIGLQAFSSCSLGLNSQDLAPKHAGALHGVMNTCGAFAGFIGVYITGYILETTGSWSSIFLLISGMSFIGFLSFVIFGSGKRVV